MFKYFFKREFQENYLGNLTGLAWVFIQPLITLFIYTIVFEKIFKTKFPEAENIGFIVYLALGFWPWTAFSEAIMRSIPSIVEKKNLIGKVKVDLKLIVIAKVTTSFMIHLIGYLFVLILLIVIGKEFNYYAIPLLLLPLIQLYILALSFSFLLSAIQVFIRDTLHLMNSLITLWFFSTPIIYSVSLMPDYIKRIMVINPVYIPINFIHDSLITQKPLEWSSMFLLTIYFLIFLFFSLYIFKKLEPHFEDFI